jgi:zinc-finger of acetyl-transferase ESCO
MKLYGKSGTAKKRKEKSSIDELNDKSTSLSDIILFEGPKSLVQENKKSLYSYFSPDRLQDLLLSKEDSSKELLIPDSIPSNNQMDSAVDLISCRSILRKTPKMDKKQLHLDLGQKDSGLQQCSICGMAYHGWIEEDRKIHEKFHSQWLSKSPSISNLN